MTNNRVCRECGKPLAGMKATAAFCGPDHRKAWNNRRMVRGAEMYDLFMALRYDRAKANERGAWTVLSNLARAYRDSDVAARDGRHSWHLGEALDRLPMAYGSEGDQR